MNRWKRKKQPLPIKLCVLAGFLFVLVLVGTCSYFYQETASSKEQVTPKKAPPVVKQLTAIGLENMSVILDKEQFQQEYEEFVLAQPGMGKVSTTLFLSNYEQLTDHVYVLYSQVDDRGNSVIQCVYNTKTQTPEFAIYQKPLEGIEDLGGVAKESTVSVADLYQVSEKKTTLQVSGFHTEKLTKKEQEQVCETLIQYVTRKYQDTDIKITELTFVAQDEEQSEEDTICFQFTVDDAVHATLSVYYNLVSHTVVVME
ncbi:MAG: hypothetical protein RR678_10710 [Lachnospiraceae bacterium]